MRGVVVHDVATSGPPTVYDTLAISCALPDRIASHKNCSLSPTTYSFYYLKYVILSAPNLLCKWHGSGIYKKHHMELPAGNIGLITTASWNDQSVRHLRQTQTTSRVHSIKLSIPTQASNQSTSIDRTKQKNDKRVSYTSARKQCPPASTSTCYSPSTTSQSPPSAQSFSWPRYPPHSPGSQRRQTWRPCP